MKRGWNNLTMLLLLAALAAPATAFAEESGSAEGEKPLAVINVTAQKRTEAENTVPISLDIATPDQMKAEHITDTEKLLTATPNVMMGRGNSGSAYTTYLGIRGVGSSEIETDPSVGVFLDGVPLSLVHNYMSNLLDVEQIEVMRGPQGTLYGRNTLGGAININSKKADPTKYEGYFSIGGGNKEQFKTEVVGNFPLLDGRAALRGAFAYDHVGSVWDNRAGNNEIGKQENYQGRLSWFQMLGDNTTLDFSVDIQTQDRTDGAVMTLADYKDGQRDYNVADPFGGSLDQGGAKLEINHDFDSGYKFTSITGYRRTELDYKGNYGPVGFFNNANAMYDSSMGFTGYNYRDHGSFEEEFDQISQELRITSPEDMSFKYVVGAYADYSKTDRTYGITNTWLSGSAYYPWSQNANHADLDLKGNQKSWSVAAFGDASYDINDSWQVFGGARVGYDKKTYNFNASSNLGDSYLDFWDTPAYGLYMVRKYDDDWDKVYVTPRAGIKFNINENNNIYASVSRGYKSGGFTTSLFYDDAFKFDEETTLNYEVGMKNLFLDGKLSLNTSLFYIDWRDQQVLAYDAMTMSTGIINAPRSRSYGVEVDLNGKFDNGIRIGAGVGYSDATYEDFDDAPLTAGGGSFDASGKQQQYHSKVTARANLGYDFALPWDNLIASADVTLRYRSKYYFDIENTIAQGGYSTVDLNFGFGNDSYEVNFWVRNLLGKEALASAAYYSAMNSTFDQNTVVSLIDPRMFGVTFTKKF
jgi:iron complex outermembrane receptor protein